MKVGVICVSEQADCYDIASLVYCALHQKMVEAGYKIHFELEKFKANLPASDFYETPKPKTAYDFFSDNQENVNTISNHLDFEFHGKRFQIPTPKTPDLN